MLSVASTIVALAMGRSSSWGVALRVKIHGLMKEQHTDQIKAATLFAELEWQERTVKKWLGESKLFRLISENRVQYIERKCEYPPDAA